MRGFLFDKPPVYILCYLSIFGSSLIADSPLSIHLIMLIIIPFQRSRVQVWLYEQINMRIEGCIVVSFLHKQLMVLWCKRGQHLSARPKGKVVGKQSGGDLKFPQP